MRGEAPVFVLVAVDEADGGQMQGSNFLAMPSFMPAVPPPDVEETAEVTQVCVRENERPPKIRVQLSRMVVAAYAG